MASYQLTPEQVAVINHPLGRHARILAVAGSGKTSTLVHRIRHMVMDLHVDPQTIQVLMFNRLAREQFAQRMQEEEIPLELQPRVNTFHSYAYGVIQRLITEGKFPGNWEDWIEDREERATTTLHRAIESLEKGRIIPEESVDLDLALQAIQLWKSSLISPPRAGYRGNPYLAKVYARFEEMRLRAHGLTYDDYVPLAVSFLSNDQELHDKMVYSIRHLIVDEYQDVNYGQQRLVELLAGNRADVMVVGDDDQTIYEWRGARPNYIIREFQTVFANKPHSIYTLSHSFRFGAVIAQCAQNCIEFNTTRVQKSLVAHKVGKPAHLFVYEHAAGQPLAVNKQLTDQVITLVRREQVDPKNIVVLCRLFAQLTGIEAEFMSRKIPFRVMGQRPFFERREVVVLLKYTRLAQHYYNPLTQELAELFTDVANTPNRMLPRSEIRQFIEEATHQQLSLANALDQWVSDPRSPLNARQVERVLALMGAMESAWKQLTQPKEPPAGEFLDTLVKQLDYLSHYDNYYGKGEASFEHKASVLNFVGFAYSTNLSVSHFLEHVAKLDTTHGAPQDQQIVMTTIFRTKGLEFDYVFIPDCDEGYLPYLYGNTMQIYDLAGIVKEPEPSENIEAERRLFYVAVTRARKAVYIGTGSLSPSTGQDAAAPGRPSRFLDEMQYVPTIRLMNALQTAATKAPGWQQKLMDTVSACAGYKKLLMNLTSAPPYLEAIQDSTLLGKIAQIAAVHAETPFRYRFAYPNISPERSANQVVKKLHSAWDEVEE